MVTINREVCANNAYNIGKSIRDAAVIAGDYAKRGAMTVGKSTVPVLKVAIPAALGLGASMATSGAAIMGVNRLFGGNREFAECAELAAAALLTAPVSIVTMNLLGHFFESLGNLTRDLGQKIQNTGPDFPNEAQKTAQAVETHFENATLIEEVVQTAAPVEEPKV